MAPPFYSLYLLTPLAKATRRIHTCVGFAVAPARRIKQHNGELPRGAMTTKALQPWEMICDGFSSMHSALRFEWALQHAYTSSLTKECMATLVDELGRGMACSVRRKLCDMFRMLFLPLWIEEQLTISFTSAWSRKHARDFKKQPPHMKIDIRPIDSFPSEGVPRSAHVP